MYSKADQEIVKMLHQFTCQFVDSMETDMNKTKEGEEVEYPYSLLGFTVFHGVFFLYGIIYISTLGISSLRKLTTKEAVNSSELLQVYLSVSNPIASGLWLVIAIGLILILYFVRTSKKGLLITNGILIFFLINYYLLYYWAKNDVMSNILG